MNAILGIAPANTWTVENWFIAIVIVVVAAIAIMGIRFLFTL